MMTLPSPLPTQAQEYQRPPPSRDYWPDSLWPDDDDSDDDGVEALEVGPSVIVACMAALAAVSAFAGYLVGRFL